MDPAGSNTKAPPGTASSGAPTNPGGAGNQPALLESKSRTAAPGSPSSVSTAVLPGWRSPDTSNVGYGGSIKVTAPLKGGPGLPSWPAEPWPLPPAPPSTWTPDSATNEPE